MKKTILIAGFQFAGIHAGIKDDLRKKDLSLIYSEQPDTLIDGVFTTNRVCAPPVSLCRQNIKKGKGRLVIINSGIANACTGAQGLKDAVKTRKEGAKLFSLKESEVFVCSTGKIGEKLPMNKLIAGLSKAKKNVGAGHFLDAVRGIMTTDQFPKYASHKGKIFGKPYTIAVMAKGAGMLRPDMATLLGYILTDLHFSPQVLRKIFRSSVDKTLNRVTVDGDTSTNDTVLILANGRCGNSPFSAESAIGRKIEREMTALLEKMARKIALDGEGATKCCQVSVIGAKNNKDAKKIAYAIGNSPLVKTALFGCDPNWGRIMAAVGYAGAYVDPNQISIRMGPTWVAKKGRGAVFKKGVVSKYLQKENVDIKVICGRGPGTYYIYMSDLTYDYVNLNAEYHT